MNYRVALAIAITMAATLWGLVSSSAGVSLHDVYAVTLNMQVNFEDDLDGRITLGRALVRNKQLINLALGRPLTNAVPAHQVLAALVACGSAETRLVVYDKIASNVLVTVATPLDGAEARVPKKSVFVGWMEVATTNHLAGGFLLASGTATLNTNDCTTRATARLAGVMDVIIEDDDGPETNTVIVTTGTVTTIGKKLGTIAP